MTEPATPDILAAALAFADAGCSVVPARMDGSKSPAINWKLYQHKLPAPYELQAWFEGNAHPGVGVVCGAVSGGLVMVELEGRAVDEGMLPHAVKTAMAAGDADLWRRVTAGGYMERSPSGGLHILYRIGDAPAPGNQKLARRPGKLPNTVDVLAETRGEGGYVVVAPSHGPTHPTGKPWVALYGTPATIPTITLDEHTAICSILRSLDAMPSQETALKLNNGARDLGLAANPHDEATPGDDYNMRHTWGDVLTPHGWRVVRARGNIVDWCRPGKSHGISATTGYGEHDLLYVFTTSTVFDSERSYSKFAAYTLLEHGGNFADAARQLRRDGYGAPLPEREPLRPFIYERPQAPAQQAATIEPVTAGAGTEHTTWWPQPLDAIIEGAADDEADKPAILAREDGHRILYAGKVNGLVGESESGKTWVALMAAEQILEIGERVLYLDFEDTAKGIVTRLRTLGVDDKALRGLTYISPDERFHDLAKTDLRVTFHDVRPQLVVVDGFNAALTMLGLELKDNTDITKFFVDFLRPLREGGAGVLTVDHVTKSREGRGDYAIGGQAKRAMVDGSYIGVEAVKPFGRGQNGILKLTSIKDRPGYVRAVSAGCRDIGQLEITDRDNQMRMRIKAPDLRSADEKGPFRPTHLMEAVSKNLEDAAGPMSLTAIEKKKLGKAEFVRAAVTRLVAEGFVRCEEGPRHALLHTSVSPYREADDATSERLESDQ